MKNPWIIFTDGACSGNPGPGGWGSIVFDPKSNQVTELGSGQGFTTNNQMELQAVTSALQRIDLNSVEKDVWIYTDSTYVIRGITQWIFGWLRRGWITAEGKEVQNKEFWMALNAEVQKLRQAQFNLDWRYSRGHMGIPGNERCDEIAVSFSKNQYPSLYKGPLLKYSVAFMDLPESHELPEQRSPTEKVKAIGYLSYTHGRVVRHNDWTSCQKAVSGVSGAKFKKINSEADVKEVLQSWGLSDVKVESK